MVVVYNKIHKDLLDVLLTEKEYQKQRIVHGWPLL